VGLFRLLLAFSVIAAHLGFELGFGSRNSVQIFFIVSGYLMSYIIVERKSYSSNLKFWASRSLRIFPTYWLVLLVTIFVFVTGVNVEAMGFIPTLPVEAQISAILANLALFFQDIVMFFGMNNGGAVVFAPSFDSTPNPLHISLIVPQSWSLALELSFYLIAPFVLKKKWILLSILGISQLLRLALVVVGVGTIDPWTYRFFPVEIGTFLMGAFIHQFVAPRLSKIKGYKSKKLSLFLNVALMCMFFVLPVIENSLVRLFILLVLCILGLPALFHQQSKSKFDNALGKLSYPVYLWHVLVILYASTHLPQNAVASLPLMFVLTCAVSVALSLATEATVDRNIEKLRKRFRSTNSA
jgi:peptidoglycan/LPS O-acetylase OafA/YrhL